MQDSNLLFNNGEAAVTEDGQSSSLQVGPGTYTVEAVVSTVTGTTPTLDLTIEESADDSTFVDNVKFPQITGVGTYFRRVTTEHDYLRIDRDIGGSGDLDFTYTCGIVPGGRDKHVG